MRRTSPVSRLTLIRNTTLFLCLLVFHPSTRGQDTVSFYFGAHEDDWQLFMNPNAYNDVHRDSTKVVFVYLTAGDAGAGLGTGGRSQPYYLARENGAKLSVKFLADARKPPVIPPHFCGFNIRSCHQQVGLWQHSELLPPPARR